MNNTNQVSCNTRLVGHYKTVLWTKILEVCCTNFSVSFSIFFVSSRCKCLLNLFTQLYVPYVEFCRYTCVHYVKVHFFITCHQTWCLWVLLSDWTMKIQLSAHIKSFSAGSIILKLYVLSIYYLLLQNAVLQL